MFAKCRRFDCPNIADTLTGPLYCAQAKLCRAAIALCQNWPVNLLASALFLGAVCHVCLTSVTCCWQAGCSLEHVRELCLQHSNTIFMAFRAIMVTEEQRGLTSSCQAQHTQRRAPPLSTLRADPNAPRCVSGPTPAKYTLVEPWWPAHTSAVTAADALHSALEGFQGKRCM